jgi:hypothetical protein
MQGSGFSPKYCKKVKKKRKEGRKHYIALLKWYATENLAEMIVGR